MIKKKIKKNLEFNGRITRYNVIYDNEGVKTTFGHRIDRFDFDHFL